MGSDLSIYFEVWHQGQWNLAYYDSDLKTLIILTPLKYKEYYNKEFNRLFKEGNYYENYQDPDLKEDIEGEIDSVIKEDLGLGINRDYFLFAYLANIRNDNLDNQVVPISGFRGIPNDASKEFETIAQAPVSFLTGSELQKINFSEGIIIHSNLLADHYNRKFHPLIMENVAYPLPRRVYGNIYDKYIDENEWNRLDSSGMFQLVQDASNKGQKVYIKFIVRRPVDPEFIKIANIIKEYIDQTGINPNLIRMILSFDQ